MGREFLVFGPTLVRMTQVPGWFALMQSLLGSMVPREMSNPRMPWVALDMSWLLLPCLLDFPWASNVIYQSVHFMNRHKEYLLFLGEPPGAVVYSKSPQSRPGIDLEPCTCSKTVLRHLPV